ncbi:hypothetical protein ABEG17_08075 [Pedococcus sp. KACC 23699]|uniref:Uncharacterized protein n=1 Tax=Pedococcus sp. KACC 23699 TaxID=3149228 RepID=A0AAU7JZJ7_9MICO
MRRGRVVAVGLLAGVLVAGAGVAAVRATTGPHTVEVSQARLRFDLPHGWHDADRRPAPTQAWVIEAAQRQGFTPQAYAEGLRTSTLASMTGPVRGGYLCTVDVQRTRFSRVPDAGTVQGELTQLHEEVDSSHPAASPLGTVLVTRYHFTLGSVPATSTVVHVAVHGEVLAITIAAAGADAASTTDPVADEVVRSLRPG